MPVRDTHGQPSRHCNPADGTDAAGCTTAESRQYNSPAGSTVHLLLVLLHLDGQVSLGLLQGEAVGLMLGPQLNQLLLLDLHSMAQ
jgi:hypothetical protein